MYKIELYNKIPIFIPTNITEDVVKLIAQKLSGSLGPVGMDLESLHGWLLKFGEDIKTSYLC